MSKLPAISGREMLKVLSKIGFTVVGRKGSHVRLKRRRDKETLIVIVPMHSARIPLQQHRSPFVFLEFR